MNSSNNKETINLLDLLSDSDSNVSDLDFTPKKKKVKRYTTRQTMIRECLQCETFRGDVRFVTRAPLVSSRLPSRFFATLSMAVIPPVSFAILRPRNTTTYLTICE
ncbi:hypothetical protein E2986_12116 [Frieseomelitta varia]|uniref:Uncharacterized protein n=1 Tax=Frieseomelitta varia TaxID=561572 RepID=A0A833RZM1_9HYME|nr:hypothetical protein E2986_12116 [Frieseomelitta varia]